MSSLIKTKLLLLMGLLGGWQSQTLFAQTVHRFDGIRLLPDQTVSLSVTGSVASLFRSYFDLFPVETSVNLKDWKPLVTLLRTNRAATALTFRDIEAASQGRRFYRLFTNHLITPLPSPSGAYRVGTASKLLFDNSRKRSLPQGGETNYPLIVTLWYPAEPRAGHLPSQYMDASLAAVYGPPRNLSTNLLRQFLNHSIRDAELSPAKPNYPVILYSHGLTTHRRDNTYRAEALASHGYVVIGLDHTDAGATELPDGSVYFGNNKFDSGQLTERIKDVRVLIDELARWNESDSVFSGRLDLERIGIFGFSFGGVTALEVARLDARCVCAVSLDGSISLSAELQRTGVDKPVMLFNSENGLFNKLRTNAYWLVLSSAIHQDFADLNMLGFSGDFTSARNRAAAIKAYTLAFFEKFLS